MFTRVFNFFKPPEYESLDLTLKAKFLHFTLLIITTACLILGILNSSGDSYLDEFIFALGGTSFICIPGNKRGYYRPIAIFIAFLVLGCITFSLIDGVGLKDAGLIAYPIFIVFTSFLLSKKASIITTVVSIGSVVLVYQLDRTGHLNPAKYSNEAQLKVISILILATGILLWVVMENWERMLQNLRETYDLTLIGWGKALEFRDQETEGHSERVVRMTIELAKRLGIPDGKLYNILCGAILHDIGKMAIPDAILFKNDSLSGSEWEVVKMHPIHAKNLLENIPYLKPALDIPYSHHERWDGSGYPEGLEKEEIPLAARIFAVVDVWDALISDRPYHPAWSKEKACEYIHDQSGILFDPQVVETFFELLAERENLNCSNEYEVISSVLTERVKNNKANRIVQSL